MEIVDVVIKIPKKCKEFFDNGGKVDQLDAILIIDAIANGTVLPEGHGRLIDADAATKDFNVFQDAFAMYTDKIGKRNIICTAPTVIEADKEVK